MISFSVVIPTYKRHNFLKRALENVLQQESNISEVLVVDDEKSEKCREIVHKLTINSHKIKIKYFQNESSQGEYFAKNWVLKYATGEYIAFLDDDDFWSKDYLKNIESYIKNNLDGGIFVSNYFNYIDEKNFEDGKIIPKSFIINDYLIHNPGMLQSNIIVKKEAFDYVGGFDTSIPCADKDFFLKINLAKYKYVFVKERNVYYQIHGGRYSQNYYKLLKSKIIFYKKYFKYYNFSEHYRFFKFYLKLIIYLIKSKLKN
tara:strand:+ start:11383 stop:12159 length:777 start_codon:yes stop_codon:yes gene_type:complete